MNLAYVYAVDVEYARDCSARVSATTVQSPMAEMLVSKYGSSH